MKQEAPTSLGGSSSHELQGYHDGTYTLFPFQKPEKKEDVMSWTQMNLFDFIFF